MGKGKEQKSERNLECERESKRRESRVREQDRDASCYNSGTDSKFSLLVLPSPFYPLSYSIEELFAAVRPGRFYAIEDMQTAHGILFLDLFIYLFIFILFSFIIHFDAKKRLERIS
jgi:hypothetical protein